MSTTEQSRIFNTVNAWERWHLGWNGITYDLKDTTDNGVFTIGDFITTGNAIRVKIPHTNQYLWIENHQKINQYDDYAWSNDGYGNPFLYPDKGIYMYIEDMKPNQTNVSYEYQANKLKVLHGNGHYDYNVSSNYVLAQEWWDSPAFNFTEVSPNPYGEHHPASLLRFDYDNNNNIRYTDDHGGVTLATSESYRMYRKDGNVIYGPAGEGMAFDVGDKVGLGNNPAIANIQYYNASKQEVSPIHIHNVTVNIESYNSLTGEYQLKILFNDADINNDTRWAGNLKLTQDSLNPINNPQRIIVKNGKKITLDQSLTANREAPITLLNGTKSFSLPTILTLESGSITTIEDGAELLVNNGSTLHIKSGATVIVKGSGKITINNGSFLCIENGASINLQNTNSFINMANGTTGINPILLASSNFTSNCLGICEITNLITGSGSIIGQTLADAGIDQIICSNPTNNILGGNPSAIQGVAPFTYSWTPTTNLSDPTNPNPSLTTALTANTTYILQVTDANGCTGTDTINLIYKPTATITTSSTNSVCPGTGTATVHVCGNPNAYIYYWNDPQFQTTPTATGLFAGTYTVQITDAVGNVTSVNAIVNPTHSTPVYDYLNPVITGNVTWNGLGSTIKVKGEVVVERGGVLTINNSNVEFAYDLINDLNVLYPRARITVQQGGILNVINSTLTGCGDSKWDGIEVWGTTDTNSRTKGINGLQGYVKLNGAIIKNALRGVLCNRSIRLNERTPNFFGARLDVDNSQFINNRNSIIFGNYAYNSLNYVKNTTFNYGNNNLFTMQEAGNDVVFIQVGDYKISSISSNVFRDINSQENVIGIKSENANYLPILTNTFYNVFTGVDASGINSLNGLAVTQNTFNQCNKGIFAKGITGLSLDQNTFNIPSSPTDTTYGMYLLDCNLYSIQENTFNGTPANNAVGLYIYNTDVANNTQTNQVYRNTFNNLSYASFGNGENTDANAGQGLTFKCNTYVGNDYDILTTVAPGISTQQGALGSSSSPAGNKFSDACGAVTDGELLNAAVVGTQPNSYQYWYHNTPTYIPDAGCYTPFQVNPTNSTQLFIPSGTGESCPTNFGSCGGLLCRDSIRLVQIANTNIINQLTTTLDGGNTTTLTIAITAGTQSAGQLKNLLLQNSPLSSAVLIALINSNYLAGIIKDVLLQNSPLSNQVLNALLSRQPQLSSGIVKNILQQSAPLAPEIMSLALANNYPGGITSQIINNQQNAPLPPSVTQLTESFIGELTRENNLLTNRLVRSFLHDIEDEYRFDSISVLLKTGGTPPPCRACAVEADVIGKNYTAAIQEINALEQQGIEPEFTLLQRTLMDMEAMPDKLMSVTTDSTLKTTVEAIAVQTNKKGSINARNLLDMAFKQKVKETYHFPQHNVTSARLMNNYSEEISSESKSELVDMENKTLFNLFPNPNQGVFTLEYKIADQNENELNIIDFTGRVVYKAILKNTTNTLKINISNLPMGIYFVMIKNQTRELLYQTKVGVIK